MAPDLVAVQAHHVRLVVDAGSADVHRRRVGEHPLLFGVAVEPAHRAQAAGDGGPRLALVLQVAGETLDIDPANLEQTTTMLQTPGGELAQIQGVGDTGLTPIAGQEPDERHPLGFGQRRLATNQRGGRGVGHKAPPCSWPKSPTTTAADAPAGEHRTLRLDAVAARRADRYPSSVGIARRSGARFGTHEHGPSIN
jgi:hypothetical protein